MYTARITIFSASLKKYILRAVGKYFKETFLLPTKNIIQNSICYYNYALHLHYNGIITHCYMIYYKYALLNYLFIFFIIGAQ